MTFLLILLSVIILTRNIKIKASGLYCDPTGGVLTAALIVGAGAYQANSQVKQGQAQKRYYDSMAETARLQGESQFAIDKKKAEIAEDAGAQQVKAEAVRNAELQGEQRVAQAANNVAGSGSAQDIAIDTMRKGKENEINLKYNADTKAWAFDTEGMYAKWQGDTQAGQYRTAGKQALSAAKRQATMTMLSTAASVATFGAMGGFTLGAGTVGSGAASAGTSGISGASKLGLMNSNPFLTSVPMF